MSRAASLEEGAVEAKAQATPLNEAESNSRETKLESELDFGSVPMAVLDDTDPTLRLSNENVRRGT